MKLVIESTNTISVCGKVFLIRHGGAALGYQNP